MMSMTRRELFLNLFKRKKSNFFQKTEMTKSDQDKETKYTTDYKLEDLTQNEEVILGQVNDFLVGKVSTKNFTSKGGKIQILKIESLPEGLQVFSHSAQEYLSLKFNKSGQILVQLNLFWTANDVLSIITGEKDTIERKHI